MKMSLWARGVVASIVSLSMVTSSIACTMLSYTDANGNTYVARTHEYPGMMPNELTYFPVGSRIESMTPDGKQGHTFNTKYAIFGATLKGMYPNVKQDTLHEAVNDQGMSISALEYTLNGEMKVTGSAEKVLSVLDFGTWALGNFKTIRELREAIDKEVIQLWLPRLKAMGDAITPVHYAIIDKTGDSVVIEFTDGKWNIFQNPTGVMTNNPPFPWHVTNLANYAGLNNVDKNSGQFNKLKVTAPDTGGALRGLPSSNMSADRFIKAAYYSAFAEKAKTPETAILTLSHLMNNFDRPVGITIDEPGHGSKGENIGAKVATSEVTYYTVLRDLNQNHYYIRQITMMNFVKFDLSKLTSIKSVKVVSFDALSKYTSWDGADLFLK